MPCCLCVTYLYFELCRYSATFWYGSMVHLLHNRVIGFCLFTLRCLHKWGNPCNVGTCWEISPWTYFHYINHVQLGLCLSSAIYRITSFYFSLFHFNKCSDREIKCTWFLASSCAFISNPKSLFSCFQNKKEISLFYLIPCVLKMAKCNPHEKIWMWYLH